MNKLLCVSFSLVAALGLLLNFQNIAHAQLVHENDRFPSQLYPPYQDDELPPACDPVEETDIDFITEDDLRDGIIVVNEMPDLNEHCNGMAEGTFRIIGKQYQVQPAGAPVYRLTVKDVHVMDMQCYVSHVIQKPLIFCDNGCATVKFDNVFSIHHSIYGNQLPSQSNNVYGGARYAVRLSKIEENMTKSPVIHWGEDGQCTGHTPAVYETDVSLYNTPFVNLDYIVSALLGNSPEPARDALCNEETRVSSGLTSTTTSNFFYKWMVSWGNNPVKTANLCEPKSNRFNNLGLFVSGHFLGGTPNSPDVRTIMPVNPCWHYGLGIVC